MISKQKTITMIGKKKCVTLGPTGIIGPYLTLLHCMLCFSRVKPCMVCYVSSSGGTIIITPRLMHNPEYLAGKPLESTPQRDSWGGVLAHPHAYLGLVWLVSTEMFRSHAIVQRQLAAQKINAKHKHLGVSMISKRFASAADLSCYISTCSLRLYRFQCSYAIFDDVLMTLGGTFNDFGRSF